MVIRELKDGRCFVSLQEDHAELSAQFAAHWGNDRFSRLRPYQTMVFATTYHDSGYREWEGTPPMNVEKGRPYAHREDVPNFEAVELNAYAKNVDWLSSQDLYAGLLVSMHRTGLWHNRYNIFTEPAGRLRKRTQPVKTAKKELEAKQAEVKNHSPPKLPASKTSSRTTIWRCRFSICCRFTSAATATLRIISSKNMRLLRCEFLTTATKA